MPTISGQAVTGYAEFTTSVNPGALPTFKLASS